MIEVLITTYNRPQNLLALLTDISKSTEDVRVKVYDDGSKTRYKQILYGKYPEVIYTRTKHHGKQKYWELVKKIFSEVGTADYYVMLPDDVRLEPDFFTRLVGLWNQISDSQKIALNPLLDGRENAPCWTGVQPQKMNLGNSIFYKCGWMDMCFICESKFFDNVTINPIDPIRWKQSPLLSSGVGEQISRQLYQSFNLYQVNEIIMTHGDHVSVMNPQARRKVPLITKRDRITASLASIPKRERSLKDTVDSIIGQVDELNVYLNGYGIVPGFLSHPKINVFRSQDTGDFGDASKFFSSSRIKGYHLTLDDDLIYPMDYVSYLVEKVEEYKRKCVISIHGARLKRPMKNYYESRKQFHCLKNLDSDVRCDVPGTGVMCYHTDTVEVSIEDFPKPNMADIWMGKLCRERGVKIIVAEHYEGWLRHSTKVNEADTIYYKNRNKATFQTKIAKQILDATPV